MEINKNTKFLNKQIMETKPLQEDLTEFYGMQYQVDQSKVDHRDYAGTIPDSELARAVKDAEDIVRRNLDKEEERLTKISDKRNYVRLSKMDPASMSWDDLEMWNDLKKGHTNYLKKTGTRDDNGSSRDDDAMAPTPTPSGPGPENNQNDVLMTRIHEGIADLGDDILNIPGATELLSELDKRLELLYTALQKNPDEAAAVEKSLKKQDRKKLCKCSGGKCEINVLDGMNDVGVPRNSIIDIHKNGTWNVRS